MTRFSKSLRSGYDRIERWFFDPVPLHALVIIRVALGSILFLSYLSRFPLIEVVYGPTGFAGHDFVQRFPESSSIDWSMSIPIEWLRLASTSGPVWVLYFVLLASTLLFALGIRPRIFGAVALFVHILFVSRNPGAMWGWGSMIQPFMLYTIFAASNSHWSILTLWRAWRGDPDTAPTSTTSTTWTGPAWPMRLLQVHITGVFLVFWSRFEEQSWLDGQALPFVLTNRDWARIDFDFTPYFGLLEIASVLALLLECGAPLALWIKPIAKYWALALIGFFISLALLSSVGWWDVMMMFVLTVFLPPEWLARLRWPDGRTLRPKAPRP